MGIRIHKMVGYGLDDVKYDTDNWKMLDPRFAKGGYFDLDCYQKEDNFTDAGFDEYLDKAIKEDPEEFSDLSIAQHSRKEHREKNGGEYSYKHTISSCVVYDAEFGMENVMVFTPPVFGTDWQRYDDIIDYYEPTHREKDGGINNGITLLNRPIWPFESYVDCRTMPPTRLDNLKHSLYLDFKNIEDLTQKHLNFILKELNVESVEEMQEYIRPIVPEELVVLLKYLNVFADDKHIHELKPMLYWYWS